jgi:hypothetical protein
MASFCVTLFDTIENPFETDACFVTSTKNLTLNKGSGYRITFLLSKNSAPVDLTGYAVRGQIRPSVTSPEVLLDMNSANLLLKIDLTNSSLIMNLPESFTRRVNTTFAVYDIELLNPTSDAYKIVTGIITFNPEVTQ